MAHLQYVSGKFKMQFYSSWNSDSLIVMKKKWKTYEWNYILYVRFKMGRNCQINTEQESFGDWHIQEFLPLHNGKTVDKIAHNR